MGNHHLPAMKQRWFETQKRSRGSHAYRKLAKVHNGVVVDIDPPDPIRIISWLPKTIF
jgi:hypothetical protein